MHRAPWVALACSASRVQQARPASKTAVVTPANGRARNANSIAAVPAMADKNFLEPDFMAFVPFLLPDARPVCFVSKQFRRAPHLNGNVCNSRSRKRDVHRPEWGADGRRVNNVLRAQHRISSLVVSAENDRRPIAAPAGI